MSSVRDNVLQTVVEDNLDIDVNGIYHIAVEETEVFLTVFPHQGQGRPVDIKTVLAVLDNYPLEKVNTALIQRLTREASGSPVKVADISLEAAKPEITVHVSRDRMKAYLEIRSKKTICKVTLEELMSKITAAGITYGIDEASLKKVLDRPPLKLLCAQGREPVDGEDAYIHYHVDFENQGRPVEREDGGVDFKNTRVFIIVKKGQLIAEKIAATPGLPGMDVLGNPIPPKPGKDIKLPCGKNVQVVEDTKIVASLDGQVVQTRSGLSVIHVLEIQNDVDLSSGNIDFPGSIIIGGSVQTGFTVKAEGDITIKGSICGGRVEGKNIKVGKGILGLEQGYVKAEENVTCSFMEKATVAAGLDVYVSDVVLHSNISAGRKIVIEGKRGLIIGGKSTAGEEIRATTAGNRMEIATTLEVGISAGLREEFNMLSTEAPEVELKLEQVGKAIAILQAANKDLPPNKAELLAKVTKQKLLLGSQAAAIKNRLAELKAVFSSMQAGCIQIAGTAHAGVEIVVGNSSKTLLQPEQHVSFYMDEGNITTGAFESSKK